MRERKEGPPSFFEKVINTITYRPSSVDEHDENWFSQPPSMRVHGHVATQTSGRSIEESKDPCDTCQHIRYRRILRRMCDKGYIPAIAKRFGSCKGYGPIELKSED